MFVLHTHQVDEKNTENHLEKIIGDEDLLQLEGLPVGHVLGSKGQNEVEVRSQDGGERPRAGHQKPSVHHGICREHFVSFVSCWGLSWNIHLSWNRPTHCSCPQPDALAVP